MAKQSDFMYVKSGVPGRIGMAEVDDMHPGGSVTVADRCRKVGKTPFAMYQQREGMLVECDGKKETDEANKFAADAVKDNPRTEDVEDEPAPAPTGPTGPTGTTGATGS
jgi:hypothetical protein